jgi:N-carbamoyl-L-amino-acid hydrolase
MLTIDKNRFRMSFKTYSAIGATENDGLHRLALTNADKAVRDKFVTDVESLGFNTRIDNLGNIFARRDGRNDDASPILIGSHLDSQPYGGRYDGQLGVLTALETLRTLEDEGIETKRPIEVVNWTNEEGSRFKPALMGSGGFTGKIDRQEILSAEDGEGRTVKEELKRIGYNGDDDLGFDEIAACLELHIEQGPFLEENGNSIGIVDGVFGMAWLEVTIEGESDHAGPTPMHTRKDASAAMVDAAAEIGSIPNRLSADTITTIGELSVSPGSINVIPNRATFTVDIRSYDNEVVAEGRDLIESELQAACKRHGTTYEIEELWQIPHTAFSSTIRRTFDQVAAEIDISYQHIVSGAGHDAKYLNEIADTGMVFVPSVDGRTHTEEEFTEWEDVVAGAQVFANATEQLANKSE